MILRLYHFYGLFTTYLLYEEVMSVIPYADDKSKTQQKYLKKSKRKNQ